ncbi:MAG: dihydroorotate dehydrogenase electron transfer subunit [Candidatus Eisenbacteria bacterium]
MSGRSGGGATDRRSDRPSRLVRARVSRIRRIGEAGTWIDLAMPQSFPPPHAGQFVEIACGEGSAFRLPRPFSLCSWSPSRNEIGILFSVVGEGSRWLDGRREGDSVDLLGPLGRGFQPVPGRAPILIGGGRGVAPMLLLADEIAERMPGGVLLYGARDAASLLPTESSPYPVHLATIDGSAGHAGTVVSLLTQMVASGAVRGDAATLYACGPMAMLRALGEWAERAGIPSQLSLETVFGCGTGICAGCAVPLKPAAAPASGAAAPTAFDRYAFACTDGPVFDGARVDWEGLRE